MRLAWILLPLLAGGFELLRRPNPDVEEGNRAFREKRYRRALEHYEEAKKGLSEEAGVRYDVGTALLALGRTDEAVEELREAVKAGAGAEAFYNLGNVHLGADRFAEAIEAYRRALQLDPENGDAKWNLEMALRRNEERRKEREEREKKREERDREERQPRDQERHGREDGQEAEADPEPPSEQDDEQRDARERTEDPQGPREQDPRRHDPQQPEAGANEEDRQPAKSSERPEPRETDAAQADHAVLDAIERNEKNLQVERLRWIYRDRPVLKDW